MNIDKLIIVKFQHNTDLETQYVGKKQFHHNLGFVDYGDCCELMSIDELTALRDHVEKKLHQRIFNKHTQPCSEY